MEGKAVSESAIVMAQMMNPEDANPVGTVHGGVIMRLIDTAAGAAAVRHARRIAVTASIDRLDFLSPIYIGDVVTFKASVNMVGTTSLEIGVRVESETLLTGETRKAASAYLTYVALGDERNPVEIPPLILETDDDIRRNCEARARREIRIQAKKKENYPC